MIGRVVSVKSQNTATVLVERTAMHPLYKKTYIQSKKYLVDTKLEVKLGDIVDFVICKPVSKNKHWKITKVLGRSFAEIAEGQLKLGAQEAIAEVMPEEEKEKENPEKEVVVEDSAEKPKSKRKDKKEGTK